jgi:hypothetical protein
MKFRKNTGCQRDAEPQWYGKTALNTSRTTDMCSGNGIRFPRHQFYRAGIIEQWGTGTLKVIDWCRDNANPAPIWEEQSGSVVATFRPAPGFTAEATPPVNPGSYPGSYLGSRQAPAGCPRTKISQRVAEQIWGPRDDEHVPKAHLLPHMKRHSGLYKCCPCLLLRHS